MGGIERDCAACLSPACFAVSGSESTVKQAESKQFSKNMDQLRPLKASL